MQHLEPTLPPASIDDQPALARRKLLRGGAVVLGVAAGTVVAAGAQPAYAADGDPMKLGGDNAASSTTSLTVDGTAGGPDPTLALNNVDGPSLYLQPLEWEFAPQLQLGQIANTTLGPVMGVDTELGLTTTFLATGVDLQDLPTPYALPTPTRLLDTRKAVTRQGILRTSSGALDSQGRMRAGSWIDVAVAVETAEFEIPSAYVNLTAVLPERVGHLTVCPPAPHPGTSTLNVIANQTMANAAFIATGIVLGRFAVRVYTNVAAHVVLDLTGVTIRGTEPVPAAASQQSASSADAEETRARAAATGRLRSTLTDRVRRALER